MKMLSVGLLVLSFCLVLGTGYTTGDKRQYQIQNGPCSYTFLLPEQENCQKPRSSYRNLAQKDDPAEYDESVQRLEQLENIMENNTQWLLKVRCSLWPHATAPHLLGQVCRVRIRSSLSPHATAQYGMVWWKTLIMVILSSLQ